RLQAAVGRVGMHSRGHAVGAEHGQRALGYGLVELVDEDRATLAQLLDDVLVVDDLLAYVDRRSVELERALDGLDGPVDTGAIAAWRGEQELGCHAPQCRARRQFADHG